MPVPYYDIGMALNTFFVNWKELKFLGLHYTWSIDSKFVGYVDVEYKSNLTIVKPQICYVFLWHIAAISWKSLN